MTENHDYNTPSQGTTNWHVPVNANWEALDTDIEVRDTDANKSNYTPKDGAKYLATDTGVVYLGDGSSWNEAPISGSNPNAAEVYASDYSGGDGGARIQAALDDFGTDPCRVHVGPQGPDDYSREDGESYQSVWLMSQALDIPSNTTLEIAGDLVLADDSEDNMLRNASWASTDRDENITITGVGRPTLDQGAGHQNRGSRGKQMDQLAVRMYGVDGLTIENIEFKDTTAWAVRPEDVTGLEINNLWFDQGDQVNNQDGVHLVGPVSVFSIDGLHGETGDDALALSCEDLSVWTEADAAGIGDIEYGTVRDIDVLVTGGAPPSTLKFVTGNAAQIHHIQVSDIVQRSRAGINVWDYVDSDAGDPDPPNDACYAVQVSGVTVEGQFGNALAVVNINGGVRGLQVDGIELDSGGPFVGSILRIDRDCEKVSVSDVEGRAKAADAGGAFSHRGGTADQIKCSDWRVKNLNGGTAAELISQVSGATLLDGEFKTLTGNYWAELIDVEGTFEAEVGDLKGIDTQSQPYGTLGSIKFVGDAPAHDTAAPAVKGSEVIASATWDPDGDGNGERVIYDGTAWQEVVDLPNW
jgi:hypothetical protein